jgi:hypothetical protein
MLLEALSKSEDCFITSEGSQCTKKVIAQVSIAESAQKAKFSVVWKQVVMQVLGSLLVLVAKTKIIYPFWTNFQMFPILYLTRYGKRCFLGHAPGLATINVIVYVNSLHGSDLQILLDYAEFMSYNTKCSGFAKVAATDWQSHTKSIKCNAHWYN